METRSAWQIGLGRRTVIGAGAAAVVAAVAPRRAWAGTPLVTMDIAHDGLADAVWLKRMLPQSQIVSRKNDRDVQGRMCVLGAGAAVLPQWQADSLRAVERVDLGEPPPGRDTWVGYHRDMRHLARLRALPPTASGSSARLRLTKLVACLSTFKYSPKSVVDKRVIPPSVAATSRLTPPGASTARDAGQEAANDRGGRG